MAAMFWTLLSLAVLCSNGGHVSGAPSPKLELEVVGFSIVNGGCDIFGSWSSRRDVYEGAQLMEAMRFATEEINTNSTILPGIDLVLSFRFICDADRIKSEVENMTDSKTIALFIEAEGFTFNKILESLQDIDIPVITSSAISLRLPDLPFHLCMIPPPQYQTKAIIDLLTHFGWTYVSVLASFEYGFMSIMEKFKTEAESHNIRIVTSTITNYKISYKENIRTLQSHPRARVVVLFLNHQVLANFLSYVCELETSFTWVVGAPLGLIRNMEKYKKALGRVILVNIHSYPLQRFNEYFHAKMEANTFNYTDPEVMSSIIENFSYPSTYLKKETEKSKSKKLFPTSPKIMYVVNGVYTIAHALRDLYNTTCHNVTDGCLLEHRETFKTSLRNTRFSAPFLPPDVQYTVGFDGDGYGPARYDFFTIQENNGSFQYQQIGSWAEELTLNTSHIMWENNKVPESYCSKPCGEHERKIRERGNPCCWVCIKCQPDEILINEATCKKCDPGYWPNTDHNGCSELPLYFIQWGDGLAIGSVCVSGLGILSTIFVGGVLMWNNNTPIVKASGREFCYILLSGVLLLFTMTFIFIARPSVVICSLRRLGLATSFSVCYSALLTKTNRITRIFTSAQKGIAHPRYIGLVSQLSICLALITCQLLGLLIWLIVDPAEVIKPKYPDKQYRILKCKSGDMKILLSLVYDVLLVLLCTVYAFKTRKYPENFNEAKCIGFTMYTTCIIWLAFLPVFYVTSNHPKVQVTTLCASVSLCAFVILGGLFLPKLYIILFHPEKNVKSGQWRKVVGHTESSHETRSASSANRKRRWRMSKCGTQAPGSEEETLQADTPKTWTTDRRLTLTVREETVRPDSGEKQPHRATQKPLICPVRRTGKTTEVRTGYLTCCGLLPVPNTGWRHNLLR
ncbi:metabotropic glutamate receptor 2-like [Leptodactylus fuscus]|uniref:metabotropic glutamate receptor 2-like n=1 Tax=Leptodactylus fuscus TaxID=238119 RepID=UPI003F4EE28F